MTYHEYAIPFLVGLLIGIGAVKLIEWIEKKTAKDSVL